MNKNTKYAQKLFRKAMKKGGGEVSLRVPVKNYHSNPECMTVTHQVAAPVKLEDGVAVVSQSIERNMGEFVIHSLAGDKKQSITKHACMDSKKEFNPFKRKKKVNVGGVTVEVSGEKTGE